MPEEHELLATEGEGRVIGEETANTLSENPGVTNYSLALEILDKRRVELYQNALDGSVIAEIKLAKIEAATKVIEQVALHGVKYQFEEGADTILALIGAE